VLSLDIPMCVGLSFEMHARNQEYMHVEIKKRIVRKYPWMIIVSNTRKCGVEKKWVGKVVKFSLILERLHGMQEGEKACDIVLSRVSGEELKETKLYSREGYKMRQGWQRKGWFTGLLLVFHCSRHSRVAFFEPL